MLLAAEGSVEVNVVDNSGKEDYCVKNSKVAKEAKEAALVLDS